MSDYDRLVVKYTFVGARPWYAHLRVDNGDEPFYEEDTNGELDTEHTATISLASGLTSNQDGKDLAAITTIGRIYFFIMGDGKVKINEIYLEKDAEDTPDTPDTPTTGDFAITIDDMVNGAVTANAESANEGTAIALTVTPAAGYKLKDLRIEVLASPEDADVIFSNARRRVPENLPAVGEFIKATLQADGTYTFTMPAHDVLVSALFKEKPLEPTLNYDKPTRTITLTNSEYSIDGTLHYTLNGAAEQTSTEETVAVVITENTTVVAWITDGDTSDEVTETFNVAAIPTVSYTDGENTVALTLTAHSSPGGGHPALADM